MSPRITATAQAAIVPVDEICSNGDVSAELTDVTVAIDPDEGVEQHPHSIQAASDAALTLKWSTSGATAVHIEGLGDFGPSGEQTLPTQEASYVLTAQAEDGSASDPWPLEVFLHEPGELVSAHVDLDSDAATFKVEVLLLDDDHNPMPGALWQAAGAIPEAGAAGDDGVASFGLSAGTEQITLSWGAGDPAMHELSFWVLFPDDREGAARRRLDNLGFSVGPELADDLKAFQANWGKEPTGSLDDVEQDLTRLHDEGVQPAAQSQG
jgi:hypothetical protein